MAFRYKNLLIGVFEGAEGAAPDGPLCNTGTTCFVTTCEFPSLATPLVDEILGQASKRELEELHAVLTILQRHVEPLLEKVNANQATPVPPEK